MKAIIMAGGSGTRLRPLTCDIPKPLARVCGQPVIYHILKLLRKNSFDDVTLTLGYLPDKIIDALQVFKNELQQLSYVIEDKPLGTAGGVKFAYSKRSHLKTIAQSNSDEQILQFANTSSSSLSKSNNLNEDLLIMSGDAICDFDLKDIMKQHKKSGVDVTIVAKRVEDPREYGLVVVDDDNNIQSFLEKPSYTGVITNLANTGVYVINTRCLRLIEDDVPFDFAKDLFKTMLKKGMKLKAYQTKGYWCDIGDIESYIGCNRDMLSGKIGLEFDVKNLDGIYCQDGYPKGNYSVISPAYIGENVTIGDGAVISEGCVIEDNVTIGSGSKIYSSVVLKNAVIGSNCTINSSVLGERVKIKGSSSVFEGVAVGKSSVVGSNCRVLKNVKIWPFKTVEDYCEVSQNLKHDNVKRDVFSDGGISGQLGIDFSLDLFTKIGKAVASVIKDDGVAISYTNLNASKAVANAIVAGVLSCGKNVFNFFDTFQSEFNSAIDLSGIKLGIYVDSGCECLVKFVCENGLPVSREFEREVEIRIKNDDYNDVSAEDFGEVVDMNGVKLLYMQWLKNSVRCSLQGFSFEVLNQDRQSSRVLRKLLLDKGSEVFSGADYRVSVSQSGMSVELMKGNSVFLNADELLLLNCVIHIKEGKDIAVPFDCPRILDSLSKEYGVKILRYMACSVNNVDQKARELATKQMFVRDAILNFLEVLAYCKVNKLSFEQAKKLVPNVVVKEKLIKLNSSVGGVLKDFSVHNDCKKEYEGLILNNKADEYVLLKPTKKGGWLRVVCESTSFETSQELCDNFYIE